MVTTRTRRTIAALSASLVLLIAVGCGSDSTDGGSEKKVGPFEAKASWPHLTCDPIVPEKCGFPFPSNVYTIDDTTTPTGRRVQIDDAMLPVALNGGKSTGAPWSKSDGFSGAGIFAQFIGATLEGLPQLDSIAISIDAKTSPTIILDTQTGQLVPHFAEIDMTRGDADQHAFIIRPVVPLEDAHRFIVAIRHVKDSSKNDIAPSPAFRALRDSIASTEPSVDQRRGLYEDIFQKLTAAGIDRGSLQLAWDFTTASRENTTGWLLHMRDEALASVGELGPPYVIDKVDENWNPDRIAYRIEGHFTAPQYVDNGNKPGAHLIFNAQGLPTVNTAQPTIDVPFEAIIPKSALTKPAALMQYGHGLLGSRTQIEAENFRRLISEKNYIIFATDLHGMASDGDSGHISKTIADGHMHELSTMFDRLHQGFLNSLLAMRMMSRGFAKDPKFGAYVDPTQRYYHGISQGGIMGGVYMAISTDVERGVLGVPGQPYTLLLNRSVDFAPFFLVMSGAYPDARDQQLLLALTQMLWDRVEPNGYTKHLAGGLPNTPPHAVLVAAARGDHQVSTFGAHIMARALKAKHLESGVRDVWGLEKSVEVEGGQNASVFTEYDFGHPPEPTCNVPMNHCEDPHGMVRKLPASDDQLDSFLRTGKGANYCANKICKFPEQGGCNPDLSVYPNLCTPN